MEVDSKVIAALIGLVGIGLGAIISSLGYFVKTRNETRKSIRKALYYLLEIRHAINWGRLDAEVAAQKMIHHASERFGSKWGISLGQIGPDVNKVLTDHFRNIFTATAPEINPNLIEVFYDSLLDLAQTHPVLAYRLRGKEKLKEAFVITSQYYDDITEKFVAELSDRALGDSLMKLGGTYRREVLDEAVSILDKDIVRVARASSIWDYARCKVLLQKSRRGPEFDLDALNNAIDKLATLLMSQVSMSANSKVASAPAGT